MPTDGHTGQKSLRAGLLGVAAGSVGQIHEILRKYLRYSGWKIGGRIYGHGFRVLIKHLPFDAISI